MDSVRNNKFLPTEDTIFGKKFIFYWIVYEFCVDWILFFVWFVRLCYNDSCRTIFIRFFAFDISSLFCWPFECFGVAVRFVLEFRQHERDGIIAICMLTVLNHAKKIELKIDTRENENIVDCRRASKVRTFWFYNGQRIEQSSILRTSLDRMLCVLLCTNQKVNFFMSN